MELSKIYKECELMQENVLKQNEHNEALKI